MSRRRFLHGASVLGASAALGACSRGGAATSASTSTTAPGRGGDGTLVLVTLYGGNDGLNTVIPVGDERYPALRGSLAIAPGGTHDLGGGFALHPALTGCKALWDDGRLAVVHGVGFDGLDRSHFHCMDVWQAASTDDLATGWIGRWLDVVGDDPLDAVVVGRRSPLLGRGARRSATVVPAGPFDLPGTAAVHELLATMAGPDDDRNGLRALAAASTSDLLAVSDRVSPLLAGSAASEDLAGQLGAVATLIEGGLPTRVYAVDLGGFDTHAAQVATHEALLAQLDAALGSFLDRLAGRPITVVIYSEFGRRVAPNGSAGSDHGGAGALLLAGDVRPGHHGEPPPLDDLVDGDLRTTVDFRSVYAGVLEGVLGIEARDVLGTAPAPLELV